MAALLLLSSIAASALAQSCCFDLTASNGATVGQLSDGQNRINQTDLSTPESTYCLSNGGITDEAGRGCVVAGDTEQFQCDQGSSPTPGFSLASNASLEYDGSAVFWSCPSSDNGGEKIYIQPIAGQTKCAPIKLIANTTCQAPNSSARASVSTVYTTIPCSDSSMSTVTSTSIVTATPTSTPTPTSTACPLYLSGDWQYPHLIIHVDESHPDTALGNSYNGTALNGTISSLFTFDIPSSYSGKTCSLIFAWPTQSQLVTSSYTSSGDGLFDFASLESSPSDSTTYDSMPAKFVSFNDVVLAPGSETTVVSWECPAGQAVSFSMVSAGGNIDYFEDYNDCAIGLYVTAE